MAAAPKAPKQYLFVSNRNIVITSTLGYSIEFPKGQPVHVPKPMHAEVMEKGILPCDSDGKVLEVADVELAPEAKVVLAPEDPEERGEKIEAAIDEIVKRNNPRDFSAAGVPSSASVTAACGWRVDAKEIRGIWNKKREEVAQREKE